MENEPPPMGLVMKTALGLYCLALIVFLLYLTVTLVPTSGDPAPMVAIGPEARLLVLIAVVGALGASVHMGTSFTVFAGQSTLSASWLWWYILRPFLGAALATVLHLVLRGILFSSADAQAVNLYGALAFAGLAGMFSKQAIEWLRQVFDQMFRRMSDVEKEDGSQEDGPGVT